MEWIVGIGVLWFLATVFGEIGRSKDGEPDGQESNWLVNINKGADLAARKMFELSKKMRDEEWAVSTFSDLREQLERHTFNQELCVESGKYLLSMTREEATKARDENLEAHRQNSSEDWLCATPKFDRVELLKFEERLEKCLWANQSSDAVRNELLEAHRKTFLSSAQDLESEGEENYWLICLGRFYLGWDSYPSTIIRLVYEGKKGRSRPGQRSQLGKQASDASHGQSVGVTKLPVLLHNCAHKAMDIKLCLFDLDDTLMRTADLKSFRGQENAGRTQADTEYQMSLAAAFKGDPDRLLYSRQHLTELRAAHPQMKWGVFTRSPRLYAEVLLHEAYPDFTWDTLVTYDDVRNTKPDGEGVWAARRECGVQYNDEIVLVGDGDVDVYAAYRGGCWAILDRTSWSEGISPDGYKALARIPDAEIFDPRELSEVLANPKCRWPELEYLGDDASGLRPGKMRIDFIGHFFPDGERMEIAVLGRLFSEREELKPRRRWHALTNEILACKNVTRFPDSWVGAIRAYLSFIDMFFEPDSHPLITVIPFKPGRTPRLEALLEQLRLSDYAVPISGYGYFEYSPDLLAFHDGAVSSHKRRLSRDERFANAEAHLFVQHPGRVKDRNVIIFDDVSTTGASLLLARRFLLHAGARSVNCMSLAKTVSIR